MTFEDNGIEQGEDLDVLIVAAVVASLWSHDHDFNTWQLACNCDIAAHFQQAK